MPQRFVVYSYYCYYCNVPNKFTNTHIKTYFLFCSVFILASLFYCLCFFILCSVVLSSLDQTLRIQTCTPYSQPKYPPLCFYSAWSGQCTVVGAFNMSCVCGSRQPGHWGFRFCVRVATCVRADAPRCFSAPDGTSVAGITMLAMCSTVSVPRFMTHSLRVLVLHTRSFWPPFVDKRRKSRTGNRDMCVCK